MFDVIRLKFTVQSFIKRSLDGGPLCREVLSLKKTPVLGPYSL
jgi:hypothetical protein